MDPKTMQRRGMMPLDEEGSVTVSKPIIRPEMQAAAERRFRQGGAQPPMGNGMMEMMRGQKAPGRFPPMDMRGAPPPPAPFRVGPPNPNQDLVPPGAMPGWVQTAQAQPSDEDLLMLMQLGLV